MLAIIAMLSACAGTGGRDQAALSREGADETEHHLERGHQIGDEASPSWDEHRRSYPQPAAHHHQEHHEPTPEEIYAGQIALLLSAQIFACAFVVVILDGSCNFYASTGYYF